MATFVGRVDPTGRYVVPDAAAVRAAYQRVGWVTLRGFLSEPEIRPIEVIYDKFMVGAHSPANSGAGHGSLVPGTALPNTIHPWPSQTPSATPANLSTCSRAKFRSRGRISWT